MTNRPTFVWLRRLLLALVATGAVAVMHSVAVASDDRPQDAAAGHSNVTEATADTGGSAPMPHHKENYDLRHLCLAIITAVTTGIVLRGRRRCRERSKIAAIRLGRWAASRPRPRMPPSLARLGVLRL